MNETKEVYFHLYCATCKYWNKSASDEPCNECLKEGSNIDSHRPVRYEKEV